MPENLDSRFGDRLDRAVKLKKSAVVVGIDPVPSLLPPSLAELAGSGADGLRLALEKFSLGIVGAVADLAPAIKPNIAFFEAFGLPGLSVYRSVCLTAAAAGLLVIGDVKRGDIGSTAAAYADGLLDRSRPYSVRGHPSGDGESKAAGDLELLGPHDALTLNPYMGSDSVTPFLEKGCGRGQGFFILVRTSNPSSSELQSLTLSSGLTVADRVSELVRGWGNGWRGESGISAVGAVVGATHPDELGRYRHLMPDTPFLVPGYGAQGGSAAGVIPAFRSDGSGAVISASRTILQAWKREKRPDDWLGAARRAVQAMNEDVNSALAKAGKDGWL